MKCSLNSLDPDLLTVISALIAIAISQNRNADDLNLIGNFIVGVGGLILTEAAQIQNQQAKADNDEEMKDIQRQLELLQKRLSKMQNGKC